MSFDFDALSVWFGYERTTPAMLVRGEVHFQFNFEPYRKGGAPPSAVLEIWQEEFNWMDEHVDGGVLTVCMHPQVIGRGHRIAMLERFVEHCHAGGAGFAALSDVARSL